jgi:CBS domain-containing protein
MESITVEELIVPLEEYATVGKDATLYDAVMSLEKAQENFDHNRYLYRHRAILVLDEDGNVLGKVSQLDALRALEPKYVDMGDVRHLSRTGLSANFIKSIMEKYALCEISFTEMCSRAANLKVTDFMSSPTEGEYIEANAPLCEAIHMLVMGSLQSLLVTKNDKVVGVLRLTDVFNKIFHTMKTCTLE